MGYCQIGNIADRENRRPYGMNKAALQKQVESLGRGAQAALARHLDLSPSTANKLLKGSRKISADEADKIREFFTLRGGDDYTAFQPNVAAIESIQGEDARAYAAVGAIVLTAAAIDMALLDVATALVPLKARTTAKLFSKKRHFDLVEALIEEATPEEQAAWVALGPRVREAVNGPRHLGAHGHLEVRPVFQFTGVPGPPTLHEM